MSRICKESDDTKVVSYDLLKAMARPVPQTLTHQPIAHSDMIDLAVSNLKEEGYQITDTEFALHQSTDKHGKLKDMMFGLIEVKSDQSDYTPIIGLRNSNSRHSSSKFSVGTRMFICDNMCFSNDHVIGHKHTAGILEELPARMKEAVCTLKDDFERTHNRMQFFKETKLSDDSRWTIIGNSVETALKKSPSAVGQWLSEYRNPQHDEFKRKDYYAFQNAFTEIAKKWDFSDRVDRTKNVLSILDEHSGFNEAFPLKREEALSYAV